MRAVVQRVSGASVSVRSGDGSDTVSGSIDDGLLVYLGVARDDTGTDAAYLADKVANLRVFMDAEEKMNLSLLDVGKAALVVSQFTLLADARKGRRPSFGDAAADGHAEVLYRDFCGALEGAGIHVQTGVFKAVMRVSYTNEGPVTILLDSRKAF